MGSKCCKGSDITGSAQLWAGPQGQEQGASSGRPPSSTGLAGSNANTDLGVWGAFRASECPSHRRMDRGATREVRPELRGGRGEGAEKKPDNMRGGPDGTQGCLFHSLAPSIYDANTSYPVPPTGRMNQEGAPTPPCPPTPGSCLLSSLCHPYHPLPGSRVITTSSGRSLPAGHLGSQELAFLPTKGAQGTLRSNHRKAPKGLSVGCDACPEPTLMMSRPGCGYSRTGSCSSMFIKPISSGSAPGSPSRPLPAASWCLEGEKLVRGRLEGSPRASSTLGEHQPPQKGPGRAPGFAGRSQQCPESSGGTLHASMPLSG